MEKNGFIITLKDFHQGQSPSLHLDSLTQLGGAGNYSVATNVDVLTPGILTQGPGLATLTAGTESGAITELVNFILDVPVTTNTTYGIAATKLHQISATAVTNAGIWPHTITNATSGNSVIEFQGALYYFYNKSSGADCGRYDLNATFDDDYFSTVPTGAAALQSAPHPVAKKEDIMLFGNGRYVGKFISTGVVLSPTKLDFGASSEVADICFHANQWWIAVNSGVTSGTNRASGQIYLYDGSTIQSQLADEVAVGVQKIGFIMPINGSIFVAYQDISGSYALGYVSGRKIVPLCFFTGSLPTYAQKTLYKNFIAFVSNGLIYAAGASIPDLPYTLSQHADGGFSTVGAIAAPFGTLMVASTQSTSFKLAKFSGYDTACTWKSLVIPTSAGRNVGFIDTVIVKTKSLSANARCDIQLEYNQNQTNSGTAKQIKPTTSANFTAAVDDVITSAGHMLANGDIITLTTTGTLPAGLSLLTNYYVVSATYDTFKVSLTSGGSPENITGTGTGTHTWTNTKSKTRWVFDKFSNPTGGIEDVRVALNWANGNTTNDCAIKSIEIIGHYKEI